MSRTQQDSVIDDDEETCPLCIEEFDLSDKNFRPCPCGYQICQFCFNSLKTTYEKSTCPNCRRPYDEKTIQYKPPTTEEYRVDQTKKRQAAQKRKEIEKREVETSSRRNLAGVRVKQQNLVYIIGLIPSVKDENTLLQTLRGENYFGQYGEIDKIVVSKAKPSAANQGIGVYVTYARNEDAALCISMVDGSNNGDRVLRAQYGTTKYCSAYLRGETCNNKSCSFLHESGEEGQNTSLQNEPIAGKPSTRPPPSSLPSQPPTNRPTQITTQAASSSQSMRRQGSKDEGGSRKDSADGSALPSSASWANKDAQVSRTRRESQAASRGSPSPLIASATLATQRIDSKRKESTTPSVSGPSFTTSVAKTAPSQAASSGRSSPRPPKPKDDVLDELIATVNTTDLHFRFNDAMFTPEELAALDRYPSMIDPFGGAKRRLQREKDAAQLAKLEAEAQAKVPNAVQAAAENLEEEDPTSGSLQLGGEPEENPRSTSQNYGKMTSVIGRPAQQFGANTGINDQFQNLSINGQDLTPQHRQQLAVLTSASQAPGLGQPQQGFSSLEHTDPRPNPFSAQQSQFDPIHGHARQSSRFSFANDTAKPMVNTRFQQPGGATQQHFYSSGVQGPPPGLKTAGTPPISGGGMFAQGYGFTSNMNSAFGGHKDGSNDMLMRGRSGTGSGHDVGKREYLISLQNSHRSPPPHAPAHGLPTSLYGPYTGTFQDPGLVKQKRKGKKHRHANTSSSGGGVVDLADPSILQARIHQAGASGQGPFGGQSQDDQDFPPLAPPAKPKPVTKPLTHSAQSSRDISGRSSTPKVPPGLSLPHAHPSPGVDPSPDTAGVISALTPGVVPVVPLLPKTQRSPTPLRNTKEPESNEEATDTIKSVREDDTNVVKKASTQVSGKAPAPSKTNDTVTTRKTRAQSSGSPVQRPAKLTSRANISEIKPKKSEFAQKLNIDTTSTSVHAASKATDSSTSTSTTRPRTLRLTTMTTPKTESVPMSAATDKSTSFPPLSGIKQLHSRQPSVSDVSRYSRPSTPTISDLLNSADISRAGSPPPTVIGGTAEKLKSKSQLKKEKRAKTKEGSEPRPKEDDSKPVALSPIEDIAPIISHQKKKRKDKPVKTPVSSSTGKAATHKEEGQARKLELPKQAEKEDEFRPSPAIDPGARESKDQPEAPSSVPKFAQQHESTIPEATIAKPIASAVPEQKMTVKALYEVSQAADNASISSILTSYFTSQRTQKILEDMRASNLLSPQSAFFATHQPLSAYRLPPDQTRQIAKQTSDNGSRLNTIHLAAADRVALLRGHPARISSNESPTTRTLITPSGTIYRHLTRAEEDRVLELEKALEDDAESQSQNGSAASTNVDGFGLRGLLDSIDSTNATGNLKYLLTNASRFGIVFDPPAPPLQSSTIPTSVSAAARAHAIDADAEDDDEDDEDEDEDVPAAPSLTTAFTNPDPHPNPTVSATANTTSTTANTRRLAAEKAAASLLASTSSPTSSSLPLSLPLPLPHPSASASASSATNPPATAAAAAAAARDVEDLLMQVRRLDAESLPRKMAEGDREVEAWKRKVEGIEKGLKGGVRREVGRWRGEVWGTAGVGVSGGGGRT